MLLFLIIGTHSGAAKKLKRNSYVIQLSFPNSVRTSTVQATELRREFLKRTERATMFSREFRPLRRPKLGIPDYYPQDEKQKEVSLPLSVPPASSGR